MEYEAVIGLETHVQLKTRSKMWCACPNQFGAPPNTLVCPVCLGLPGVLPVPNEEAIRLTLLTGMLLNCELPPLARFDRKSYFYPDMPKNYQITQYDLPSTRNGYVEFEFEGEVRRVRIARAHLEEDVGKSFHFDQYSGVDFNRAGVPLLEIVSEPDIRGADMAYAYLTALKEILVQGGVSDCDMEKGMVRCDVNVSVRPRGSDRLGAKIEIKNMNSFSGVRRALEYEIARQIAVLESGGTLVQSTRRWDELTGTTEEMRTKEEAHDYRYFPDPDLLPVAPEPAWLDELRARCIELPLARKHRLMRQFGLPAQDAEVFKSDPALARYFESLAPRVRNPKLLANWIINNLRAKLAELQAEQTAAARAEDPHAPASPPPGPECLRFPPGALVELVELVENRTLSSTAAQQVFAEMFATGRRPADIVQEKGLAQVSDAGQLEKLCDEVLAAHPGPAEDYRKGKTAALNFLKGQVMKLSRGKANPVIVGEILERKLRG
ncbi:Asp-tRNA(Asn)/Glu-tRNA(Gln) amidotransferase subunit GatB [Limisphaera sp. 4302-co]|uniref:Asp-tRNA(Asn)/Glu-tRNA(Gln) amidotransferase subunit GatB n=1 Tax=Limisphaera sp. 4302-co TaxID=3400417 RepID=UPI003C2855E7